MNVQNFKHLEKAPINKLKFTLIHMTNYFIIYKLYIILQ